MWQDLKAEAGGLRVQGQSGQHDLTASKKGGQCPAVGGVWSLQLQQPGSGGRGTVQGSNPR